MIDRVTLHILDGDSTRRAQLARLAFAAGHHAEIYASTDELISHAPSGGLVLAHDDPPGEAVAARGVSVAVVRLPQVHDPVKQGLITWSIGIAREKGLSAYIGDGSNRLSAAHISDVARLYRLALDHHTPGARWHAVDEEGVPLHEIAQAIGAGLGIPVKSLTPDEAAEHFGGFAAFAGMDLPASSALTRERLGWTPTGPSLMADLHAMDYGLAAAA